MKLLEYVYTKIRGVRTSPTLFWPDLLTLCHETCFPMLTPISLLKASEHSLSVFLQLLLNASMGRKICTENTKHHPVLKKSFCSVSDVSPKSGRSHSLLSFLSNVLPLSISPIYSFYPPTFSQLSYLLNLKYLPISISHPFLTATCFLG